MRVLLATADLGEGHNAAARALAEAFAEAYPGCRTRTVETLRLMGRPVAIGARESYRLAVGPLGWCYEAFFEAVWRYHRFADAITWSVGRRAGPALERHVREFGPDVVVSTFPMASAGFAWLRRAGPAGRSDPRARAGERRAYGAGGRGDRVPGSGRPCRDRPPVGADRATRASTTARTRWPFAPDLPGYVQP